MSRYTQLPDGSAFFVATIPHTNPLPPVYDIAGSEEEAVTLAARLSEAK